MTEGINVTINTDPVVPTPAPTPMPPPAPKEPISVEGTKKIVNLVVKILEQLAKTTSTEVDDNIMAKVKEFVAEDYVIEVIVMILEFFNSKPKVTKQEFIQFVKGLA